MDHEHQWQQPLDERQEADEHEVLEERHHVQRQHREEDELIAFQDAGRNLRQYPAVSPTCRSRLTSSARRPVRSGQVQHPRLPKAWVDQEEHRRHQLLRLARPAKLKRTMTMNMYKGLSRSVPKSVRSGSARKMKSQAEGVLGS